MSYIIHRNTSSTTRLQNTYSCLLKKHKTINQTIKNLEKSTEFSEFLKLHSVLKLTTSLGKKFQMLTTLVVKKCLR